MRMLERRHWPRDEESSRDRDGFHGRIVILFRTLENRLLPACPASSLALHLKQRTRIERSPHLCLTGFT